MDGYRLQKTTIIYEKIRERKNFFWKRKQESRELNVVKCQKQIVARTKSQTFRDFSRQNSFLRHFLSATFSSFKKIVSKSN